MANTNAPDYIHPKELSLSLHDSISLMLNIGYRLLASSIQWFGTCSLRALYSILPTKRSLECTTPFLLSLNTKVPLEFLQTRRLEG